MAHQGPVLESVQEANQLLRQKGDLLAAEDKNAMTDALSNLKSRYENLNVQSSGRVSNLRFALDDLEKVEPEAETLEKWLKDAEQKLETSIRRVEQEPSSLARQVEEQRALTEEVLTHAADLKFINMTGQTFLNNAKVFTQIHSFDLFP